MRITTFKTVAFAIYAAILLSLAPRHAFGQVKFNMQTRAEATDYRETSHYSDVIAFLSKLKAEGAPITLTSMGTSAEGRDIPLVIAARPMVANADEARRQGKLVVYLQANIHAGEVEGKEATLILLRELAKRDRFHWFDRLVLLVAPIYNCDGNEKFGSNEINRSHQDGPDLVGERANGQGLDLNRDCIKAETPEMQGALKNVYTLWNPDVMMDLHTTDGTRHGFVLTYSPSLNPNTDAGILSYARDRLLPDIRARMRKSDKMELFDYGDVQQKEGERVFMTFGEEGRYVTNYAGLRNRFAILSEAASFQPFLTRVHATLRFVQEVLNASARNSGHIKELIRAADKKVSELCKDPKIVPELGVRFDFEVRATQAIPLEKTRPENEINHRKAPLVTDMETLQLPVYDRFKTTRTARFPTAYLVPEKFIGAISLMKLHGIKFQSYASQPESFERFQMTSVTPAQSPFQKHYLTRLEGRFRNLRQTPPPNMILVPTDQPLGILIFHMLEPESLDGLAAWELLGEPLKGGDDYPILKLF